MHVMRNLGKWKIPISRIFGVPASDGSFFGLIQPLCTFCTFYHVLLFYLSRTFRCFPCYALLHWFVSNSFCSSNFIPASISMRLLYNISCCVLWLTVCGCGCSFVFVWTLLCTFLSDRFYGCFYIYWCWLLIMQIIKTYDVIRPSRIAP